MVVRHRIVTLAETGSTNADAMRLALAGEALPLWVRADRQTAGRGRAGRSWHSGPENLQASLAIHCDAQLQKASELSLLAGIAVVDAIRAISPLADNRSLRLKWPNDVLIGPAKAGGILLETTTARREPGFLAVIGFGVNVGASPSDLGRATASLVDGGFVTTPEQLLDALADQCAAWLQRWDCGKGFADIKAAWMERAGPLGEALTITTASGPVSGTYLGLSDTGGLVADLGGTIETITFGDVFLIAPQQQSDGQ